MHDVIVPNVDDETYEALKKRASAEGAPLGDWLRRKLEREALLGGTRVPRPRKCSDVSKRLIASVRCSRIPSTSIRPS